MIIPILESPVVFVLPLIYLFTMLKFIRAAMHMLGWGFINLRRPLCSVLSLAETNMKYFSEVI